MFKSSPENLLVVSNKRFINRAPVFTAQQVFTAEQVCPAHTTQTKPDEFPMSVSCAAAEIEMVCIDVLKFCLFKTVVLFCVHIWACVGDPSTPSHMMWWPTVNYA